MDDTNKARLCKTTYVALHESCSPCRSWTRWRKAQRLVIDGEGKRTGPSRHCSATVRMEMTLSGLILELRYCSSVRK